MKTARICEIHGFAIFPVVTYPLFLESSDFQECSDYVFLDFLHKRISIKIQFLMQPEKSCNQAFLYSVLLCFILLFVLLLSCWFLPDFQKATNCVVKGHELAPDLPSFASRFAVFWNAGCPRMVKCLATNKIRFALVYGKSSSFS